MELSAIILAFLSAVLMGTIGVFSKITGLSAEVITFFRLILGAFFMLFFLAAQKKLMVVKRWPTWLVLINGLFLAGFIIFYIQAMNYTSMANAIMLIYLAPLAASVIAHFFLGEKLSLSGFLLIMLALLGFWMMMEFTLDLSTQSRDFIGICFGSLAFLSYAGFILVNRVICDDVHVYTRAFYQLFAGGCVMIPFAAGSLHEVSISNIPWLIGVGFFPGFLAIFFAVAALSRLPAAMFGTIAYTEPVAVIIFGWTIFQEVLSPLQICGALLIVVAGIAKTVTAKKKVPESKRIDSASVEI